MVTSLDHGSTRDGPKSGHFTCSRERTDHVLPTPVSRAIDNGPTFSVAFGPLADLTIRPLGVSDALDGVLHNLSTPSLVEQTGIGASALRRVEVPVIGESIVDPGLRLPGRPVARGDMLDSLEDPRGGWRAGGRFQRVLHRRAARTGT